ncbi:MAG: CBS domain-containing protein [Thermodesulfobacteriota bacterium]
MADDKKRIIRARDVMQKEIVTIDGMATVRDAAALMRSKNVFSVLIEKRDADDEWGILVVQDFIREVLIPSRSPDDVHVYEIMKKPVITVPADMDIRYVARMLYRAGVRRAPVKENGELLGMVTLSSLILENELLF